MSKKAVPLSPKDWVKKYGNILYKYTLPRVENSRTAEDLVQETFLAGLKSMDKYNGTASEKSWLFAILKHKLIDYYRHKVVEASTFESNNGTDDDWPWFDGDGMWADSGRPKVWAMEGTPAETRELRSIIHACKEKLKELQKMVFTLKYMDDVSTDEICKALNISATNYWVLVHRAKLQMRACIEKKWL